MTPSQTRKRKSEHMATPEATTPTGTQAVKKMRITQTQKQALIDNLQLEVTERARRLRAQYALQCNDLRTRIERRINRIPMAMRNITMAELMSRHEGAREPGSEAALKVDDRPLPQIPAYPLSPKQVSKPLTSTRNKKRKSSEIHIASDKENDVASETSMQETLPVQKNTKRTKTNTGAPVSRNGGNKGGVLSPRSHNSRTLPRSPIKEKNMHPLSPSKQSYIARPISPLKSASPFKSAASAATSAITASVHGMLESARQRGVAALASSKSVRTNQRNTSKDSAAAMPPPAKPKARGATTNRAVSQMSNHSASTEVSTTSNNTDTTVITKPKRGKAATTKAPTTAGAATKTIGRAKKAAAASTASGPGSTTATLKRATSTAAMKKAAATTAISSSMAETSSTSTGRRILRKRN